MAFPSSNLPRITFRLPEKLKSKLESAAAANGHGLTAELVTRLDMSFIHEVEGRESDNRSLRNEVMELRYMMMSMLGALLEKDTEGLKDALESVFSEYRAEMQAIERDGKAAHARHIEDMRRRPE